MKGHGGLGAVLAQNGNEEVTCELVEMILDEAAKFAPDVLRPINSQGGTVMIGRPVPFGETSMKRCRP